MISLECLETQSAQNPLTKNQQVYSRNLETSSGPSINIQVLFVYEFRNPISMDVGHIPYAIHMFRGFNLYINKRTSINGTILFVAQLRVLSFSRQDTGNLVK